MKVTRRCAVCGMLCESNTHKYCPVCAPDAYRLKRVLQQKRYRQRAMQDGIRLALAENKQIKADVSSRPIPTMIMTDMEQLAIDAAAPRHIDRPLQDPRNRFIIRGCEWLWRSV